MFRPKHNGSEFLLAIMKFHLMAVCGSQGIAWTKTSMLQLSASLSILWKAKRECRSRGTAATPLSLGEALAKKVLRFKTHERSLNEFLDETEGLGEDGASSEFTLMIMRFDRSGADSDTGRIRQKFGELPLTEALQEIHRYRIQAGASPKSRTNWIDYSAKDPWLADGKFSQAKLLITPAPPQVSLGATVENNADDPLLIEVKVPLVLATDKRRRNGEY